MARMPFDPAGSAYVDTAVARGFPMGGIGSGGFGFGTDGRFGELGCNDNWMAPIREARGCFHALFTRRGSERRTVVLRRASDDPEYGSGTSPARSSTARPATWRRSA